MGSLARGLTQVGAKVVGVASKRDEIQARASEVKRQKAVSDASSQPDVIKGQMDALNAQNKSIINKQNKSETFDAFKLYSKTGQVKHLANLVKNNEGIRKSWLNVASIEPLNPQQDSRLLTQKGIKPEDFNSFKHLKAVMPNGETMLFDVEAMMGGTGYLAQQSEQELDMLIKQHKLLGGGKDGKPTAMQKNAAAAAAFEGKDTPEAKAFQSLMAAETGGVLPARLAMVADAKEKLNEAFEGDFLAADLNQPGARIKAEDYVHQIEKAGKLELSNKDKADIKEMNDMLALGADVEGKLTPEVTGVVDNLVRKAKLYMEDTVTSTDTVAATSAYAAYRNVVRHALFGSVLTPGEVASFNEAFGSLSQKYPAVVTQFKTSLLQLKSKYESISSLNDSYVSKFYLGKSQGELAVILGRIDDKIELLEEHEPGGRQFKTKRTKKVAPDTTIVVPTIVDDTTGVAQDSGPGVTSNWRDAFYQGAK